MRSTVPVGRGRAAIEIFASKIKDHFGTNRSVANSGERLGSFGAKRSIR
ncbi:hypothetical protein [Bradyrhizobium sp. ORS 375]|nr:hypothetical protein [Bradyrhizobium sp. ORS 375]